MHTLVTLIAKYFILIPVVVAAYAWYSQSAQKRKQFLIYAFCGAIASVLLAKIGSMLHTDPRPFVVGHFQPYFNHGNDNGFPSDHTLLASFLAFVVWRYNKRWGQELLLVAILIGLSRVIAGVHHLQDIIASIIFAALGTYVAWLLVQRVMPDDRPRRRPVAPVSSDTSNKAE